MTSYKVIIDADNITLEKYFLIVEPILKKQYPNHERPLLICQSNIIIKYKRGHNFNMDYMCSQTKQKNAADARIIFETGKMVANGDIVIIVSNDNIYKEVECENVILVQFDASNIK
jgi:hypothetical protein